MASMRPFLYLALAVVCFFLWQAWVDFKAPEPVRVEPLSQQHDPLRETPAQPSVNDEQAGVPQPMADEAQPEPQATTEARRSTQGELITVETDLLRVLIDPVGGELVSATLLEYRVSAKEPEPKVELFERNGPRVYTAQSGLISGNHPAPSHTAVFRPEQTEYRLGNGQDELLVRLHWEQDDIVVTREYRFQRDRYLIEQRQRVENRSQEPWRGQQYAQLQRTPRVGGSRFSFTNPENYAFYGAAIYSEELGFEKISFSDIDSSRFDQLHDGGWAAMIQHYFVSAWIPDQSQTLRYETARLDRDVPRYLVRWREPGVQIEPGQSHEFSASLFVGPKLQDRLREAAPGMHLAVDYGFFTVFSQPLFWLLNAIHSVIGNWGWSIIFLTLLVKLVFYKLTETQYRSMARMRKLQPRIMSLRERYADDRTKLSEAMMKLYKEEKVNPLGGCLPLLVQIPVFLALYWVLLESVELRQASFMFWLQDLSSPDPYYILPVIMGIAAWTQQKLNPMISADPIQQRVMMALPIFMAVMFAFFQAGLVLYWTTNQVLGLAQQYYITRKIEREETK